MKIQRHVKFNYHKQIFGLIYKTIALRKNLAERKAFITICTKQYTRIELLISSNKLTVLTITHYASVNYSRYNKYFDISSSSFPIKLIKLFPSLIMRK